MMMKRYWLGLCLSLFFALPVPAEPKKVLIVDSYHAGYQWSHDYREAISQALGARVTLSFFEMDTKRRPQAEYEIRARDALGLIARTQPDLVITGDDAALRYVGARLAGGRIPVVYLGINNNPRVYFATDHAANVTGVLERPLIQRNVSLMRPLLPDLRRVLILFDKELTSDVIRDELFAGQSVLQSGEVEIELAQATDFVQWQRYIDEAPGRYQAIWVGLYQSLRMPGGKLVPDKEVIGWTAQHSKLPLFGFWDFAIGAQWAIGGLVLSGSDQGRQAAEMAGQILFHGRVPASLFPSRGNGGELLFSREALRHFGLQLTPYLQRQARMIE